MQNELILKKPSALTGGFFIFKVLIPFFQYHRHKSNTVGHPSLVATTQNVYYYWIIVNEFQNMKNHMIRKSKG